MPKLRRGSTEASRGEGGRGEGGRGEAPLRGGAGPSKRRSWGTVVDPRESFEQQQQTKLVSGRASERAIGRVDERVSE